MRNLQCFCFAAETSIDLLTVSCLKAFVANLTELTSVRSKEQTLLVGEVLLVGFMSARQLSNPSVLDASLQSLMPPIKTRSIRLPYTQDICSTVRANSPIKFTSSANNYMVVSTAVQVNSR
jgi:hypothetical protein